jgi:biopolymer transport protein ExbB
MENLMSLFQKGGIIMYPLVFCSFCAIAITVERILFFREKNTSEEETNMLNQYLIKGDIQAALALTDKPKGDVEEVTNYYLNLHQDKIGKIQALETKVSILMLAYEKKLNFLSMIVTLAPLLGLLGTIFGMIASFNVFSLRGSQPFAITSGIGEALIATAFGLIVAIVTLVLHHYLKYRITTLNRKLELCCLNLLTVNN